MPFVYPKPLAMNGRTWNRVDSWAAPVAGQQVMYRLAPKPWNVDAYDHISIVLGADGAPLDGKIHVTMKCAAPAVIAKPGEPPVASIAVGSMTYVAATLVFYWDFACSPLKPATVRLVNAHNESDNRAIKQLNAALASVQIMPFTQVSAHPECKKLYTGTEGYRDPKDYATKFWKDLLDAQP